MKNEEKRVDYQAPELETTTLQTEAGFAQSFSAPPDMSWDDELL